MTAAAFRRIGVAVIRGLDELPALVGLDRR